MTSKPLLIHYGLAPFKSSIAPFKMLMRNFQGPDLFFVIRVSFIDMGKGLIKQEFLELGFLKQSALGDPRVGFSVQDLV